MTQDITSLIEKLEGAEVGSEKLGTEVLRAVGWFDGDAASKFPGEPRTLSVHVTTSLDAALALAERLELSVGEILNDALEGPSGVGIWQSGWNGTISTIPQIARFVCIAILRAQSEAR